MKVHLKIVQTYNNLNYQQIYKYWENKPLRTVGVYLISQFQDH